MHTLHMYYVNNPPPYPKDLDILESILQMKIQINWEKVSRCHFSLYLKLSYIKCLLKVFLWCLFIVMNILKVQNVFSWKIFEGLQSLKNKYIWQSLQGILNILPSSIFFN